MGTAYGLGIAMENIREFNKDDWQVFAGTATFPSGKLPLVAEAENGAVVVAGGNGIEVYPSSDMDEEGYYYLTINGVHDWEEEMTQTLARVIMETLPEQITEAALDDFGFIHSY